MRLVISSTLFVSALASLAAAHGQVRKITTHNPVASYIAADAYAAANPSSPIRKISEYGPAAPFTGANITCGPGGNIPVSNLAPVVAGSEVTFDWNPWNSDHKGPVMTYVARCPNGCATFKGDTGNVWVKIAEDGYNPNRTPPWAEESLHSPGTYTIKIPASLANGEYLLRHEVLGLHVAGTAGGAQFYPTCIQIKVTGGGSANPTGIALPGAYQVNDPGILVQLWQITPSNPTYVIPGGPVILQGGPGYYGGTAPTPTTTTGSSSTTASGPLQTAYGQCGGQSWTGATNCVSGYTCKAQSIYYSQCVPV
ncbi:hypothetical protein FRC01_011382 [Tulasnella sp. 417]|nr:hypothetical protein FRC01_011382 [Tulasnella sp. 417]